MSRGLAYPNGRQQPQRITGGSQNGFQENCVQRANADGVLRAVPIRGLFHTAWAKSSCEQSQQKTKLLDHPVGAGEHRCRHFEAERLGGLQIDYQLVFGRRLHWQIGRLLALEDAIDIAGRTAELIGEIRPIGDQPAGYNEVACVVNRRQLSAGCQLDDQIAVNSG